jgi:hypothetical protein
MKSPIGIKARLAVWLVLCTIGAGALHLGCGDSGGGGFTPTIVQPPTTPTTPQPPVTQKLLNVPYVGQPQNSQWCWAACSEMVLRSANRTGTQCQILSVKWNADCCSFPQYCNTAGTFQDMIGAWQYFGNFTGTTTGPLSFSQVTQVIDSGRPFVISYQGQTFVGHVVVCYGYDIQGNVYIHDPVYGSFVVPYGVSIVYGTPGSPPLVWQGTLYPV